MSVYADPDTHAANPPDTWQAVKAADRLWQLRDQHGTVLDRFTTKKDAEQAREDGMVRRLYDQETRWYAGETIRGWKSWAVCKAERDAVEARWGKR